MNEMPIDRFVECSSVGVRRRIEEAGGDNKIIGWNLIASLLHKLFLFSHLRQNYYDFISTKHNFCVENNRA
jgi:hypothetical protein